MNNGNLKISPSPLRGFKWYLGCKVNKRPLLVNLEVTKRCNARCDFCACWQIKVPDELTDFTAVAKKFKPVVLSISGGEPLVRKDLADILRQVRPYCHYMVMVTNGALLTEDVADKLSGAGLNQMAISLDFTDEAHDENRHVPGLFKKVSAIVPRLAAKGYKIVLNTVIMEANLDHILPLAHKAKAWGANISFSSYCALKRSDELKMIYEKRLRKLEDVIGELKLMKRSLGHVKNSDYYLNGIPRYFRNGGMGGCKAGKNWVQVEPNGMIQPCSEMPAICRYDEYDRRKVPELGCTACWYTCRGEAEAPHLAPSRLIELVRA